MSYVLVSVSRLQAYEGRDHNSPPSPHVSPAPGTVHGPQKALSKSLLHEKMKTEHLRFSHFPSSIPPSASSDVRSSVMYDLALDPGRLISRAIFDETKNWTLTRRKTLGLGEHCDTMKLLLPVRTLGSGKGRGRQEPKASLWHLHSLLSEVGRVGACSWRGESRA